jgi:hypothetical protein
MNTTKRQTVGYGCRLRRDGALLSLGHDSSNSSLFSRGFGFRAVASLHFPQATADP